MKQQTKGRLQGGLTGAIGATAFAFVSGNWGAPGIATIIQPGADIYIHSADGDEAPMKIGSVVNASRDESDGAMTFSLEAMASPWWNVVESRGYAVLVRDVGTRRSYRGVGHLVSTGVIAPGPGSGQIRIDVEGGLYEVQAVGGMELYLQFEEYIGGPFGAEHHFGRISGGAVNRDNQIILKIRTEEE
ncbi:MAG: hypothetical protein EA376_00900 [Phycisphaeraceae bacterium]|nr:MAG: hypothetical protein EA376_00900 [Phycisphaeraceae bacterium]